MTSLLPPSAVNSKQCKGKRDQTISKRANYRGHARTVAALHSGTALLIPLGLARCHQLETATRYQPRHETGRLASGLIGPRRATPAGSFDQAAPIKLSIDLHGQDPRIEPSPRQ